MSRLEQMLETLQRPTWVDGVVRRGRVALAALLVSGGLVLGCSHYESFARVQSVEVVGAEHAGQASIRHLADLSLGESLLLIDTQRSLDQVASHPWVEHVELSRHLSGEVVVTVQEHESALLLATHKGLYRVSPQGKVFVRARGGELDQVLLTGLSPELLDQQGPLSQRIISEALAVLVRVDSSSAISRDDLSELHFDPLLGFSLLMRNGTEIRIGYLSPDQAITRLDAMVQRSLDLSEPTLVDLDLDGLALATPLAALRSVPGTPPS
jgi:cell division septal protein FtsQ